MIRSLWLVFFDRSKSRNCVYWAIACCSKDRSTASNMFGMKQILRFAEDHHCTWRSPESRKRTSNQNEVCRVFRWWCIEQALYLASFRLVYTWTCQWNSVMRSMDCSRETRLNLNESSFEKLVLKLVMIGEERTWCRRLSDQQKAAIFQTKRESGNECKRYWAWKGDTMAWKFWTITINNRFTSNMHCM